MQGNFLLSLNTLGIFLVSLHSHISDYNYQRKLETSVLTWLKREFRKKNEIKKCPCPSAVVMSWGRVEVC